MSTIEFRYDNTIITDVMWALAHFESQMAAIPGAFEVRIKDVNRVHSFVTGKHVKLTIDGSIYYGGIVTQVSRTFAFPADDTVTAGISGVKSRIWILRGVDYNIWFDKRVLFNKASPKDGIPKITGEPTDKEVIEYICTNYLDLSDTSINFTTYVDETTLDIDPDHTYYLPKEPGTVWRQQMKDLSQWTGSIYYIDHSQRLHYHALESVSPGWSFSDTPDRASTFGFRDFEFLEDGTNIVNDALLWGGAWYGSSGSTSEVNFGRYTNNTSVTARGRWQLGETHFNEEGYASDANLTLHAKVIVEGDPGSAGAGLNDTTRGLVNPQKQIRMTWFSGTTPTPLIPGSVVTTYINTFGLTVSLPVRSIRISFVTPTDAKFEGFFGITTDDPWTLWKYMRKVQETVGTPIQQPVAVSDGSATSVAGTIVSMTPTPAPNGSVSTFTVADAYIAGLLQVWMNGLLQRRNIDYTENASAGTFTFPTAPLSGDVLWVEYTSAGG